MVRRPVRALLASPAIGKVIVLTQQADRIADALGYVPKTDVRPSSGTIAETILALIADPDHAWPLLVTTADHALLEPAMVDEFCAAAGSSDIAIGVVERETLLQRASRDPANLDRVSAAGGHRRQSVPLGSPEVAPAIEHVAVRRAGPQEGVAAARRCSGRSCCVALLRLLGLDEIMARAGESSASKSGPSGCPIRSPGSTSTSPPTTNWSKRSWRGAHERPRDLRHGPDRDPARDLHAVPAPLRAAPRAVAAAVPAARPASMLAYVAKLIDRGAIEGDQSPPAARRDDPPARPQAVGRKLRRGAGGEQHPPRRAQGDRPRQGRRPAAGAGDRLLPPLRATRSPSGWASTTSSAPAR